VRDDGKERTRDEKRKEEVRTTKRWEEATRSELLRENPGSSEEIYISLPTQCLFSWEQYLLTIVMMTLASDATKMVVRTICPKLVDRGKSTQTLQRGQNVIRRVVDVFKRAGLTREQQWHEAKLGFWKGRGNLRVSTLFCWHFQGRI
jgi:hypothetical protein